MSKIRCCNRNCCILACGIVGAFLVILGGMLVWIFDTAYVAIVENNLIIADDTDAFEAWKAPPPYYLEFYVFNCTNPEEFLAGAASHTFVKPRFEELGPYVYRLVRTVVISSPGWRIPAHLAPVTPSDYCGFQIEEYCWERALHKHDLCDGTELLKDETEFIDNPDDYQELKFRSTGKYYFEPKLSGGKESDLVTTVNLIAVGAPSMVEYALELGGNQVSLAQKAAIRRSLNILIRDAGSQLLFQKTAKELFFGFNDDLLSALVNIIEMIPGTPDELPNEFGLFQTMNISAGWYEYKIYTGKGDYRLMNVVTEYEGKRKLDYWFGDECNMINGTDGTTVEAFMKKDERIYFFVDDICRSMYATFHAEVDVKGLPGWEYRVPAELFEAPSKNKENECFCPDLNMEVCKYNGGLPLTTCQAGAPVFMTSPHFLYAPHYLDFVEGLDPIEEQHATPLVYEPSTGICLKADKRLQISMYMQPSQNYDILDTFTTPYAFPVMWLNESYTTSDEDAEAAYGLLVVPGEVFAILQILFCIIGGVMLLGSICFFISMKFNQSSSKIETDSVDSYKKSRRAGSSENPHHVYENPGMELEKNKEADGDVHSVVHKEKSTPRTASNDEGSTSSSSDDLPVTAL